MYNLIKPLLFTLDPETAHHLTLQSLHVAYRLGLANLVGVRRNDPRHLLGLDFPNPVGLAAGLDKNGDYIDALSALGFGFIEIGTITPKPQSGNPKPRLFRLVEQEAIINRMGFNNKGADYVAHQLAKTRYKGILGINIGKNKDTPVENAVEDYLYAFRALWKYASYITINISSPNTPGLRDLQHSDMLTALLSAMKQEQALVLNTEKKYIPLVVKISPDLSAQAIYELAEIMIAQKIDGVIATNTTLSRSGVEKSPFGKETGGLSGKPLHIQSTQIVRELASLFKGRIPIIASGGIMDKKSAREKMEAGASLIQLYTGFIYHGPALIKSSLS